jgi:hypothetical protein
MGEGAIETTDLWSTPKWIYKGSITRLSDALRLSRAFGIPIDQFASNEDEERD